MDNKLPTGKYSTNCRWIERPPSKSSKCGGVDDFSSRRPLPFTRLKKHVKLYRESLRSYSKVELPKFAIKYFPIAPQGLIRQSPALNINASINWTKVQLGGTSRYCVMFSYLYIHLHTSGFIWYRFFVIHLNY